MALLRAFLVEDESLIRETLRDTVPWERCGYEFVGEASDGEIALPQIRQKKPDVLITDIRMPFMDGLALSKQVLREFPQIKVIIISGFDDFKLAQQAIEIGVEQYLLKPISQKKLIDILSDVRVKIEHAREQKEYGAQFHFEAQEYEQNAHRKFFDQMVTGQLSVEQIYEQATALDLDLRAQCYALAFFSIVPEHHGKAEHYKESAARIRDALLEHFLKYPEYMLVRWDLTTYAVLIKSAEAQMPDCLARCIHAVEEQYESNLADFNWYVAVSAVTKRLSALSECADEVYRLMAYRYLMPAQHILTAQTVGALVGTGNNEGLLQLEVSQVSPSILLGVMRNAGEQEVLSFAEEYVNSLSATLESAAFCQYLMLSVRFTATEYVASLGLPQQEFLQGLSCLDLVGQNITTTELKRYIVEILLSAIHLRDEISRKQSHGLIRQAAHYIDQHYTEETLSLNGVAKKVNISANYLSAVFSQEMGCTLTEYITGKRMSKARELLRNTDLQSGQIAMEIGYRDPHYFSFIFKKTQGCTPRDFRAGKDNL